MRKMNHVSLRSHGSDTFILRMSMCERVRNSMAATTHDEFYIEVYSLFDSNVLLYRKCIFS